ncbi:phospholipase A2 inhibitor gamma subunit B-like [Pogona vitticeps]
MQGPITRLFLFFTLLPTSVSLTCEICSGDTNCTGEKKACPEGQDACAINLMQGFRGTNKFWTVSKNCTSSFICHLEPVDVALGEGKSFKANISCCVENNCIPAFPKLPRSAKVHNGKICPTCFSATKDCSEKPVYCSGSDIYCLSFILVQDFVGHVIETTTKGCTSESSCLTLTKFNGTLFPGSTIKNLTCTPAKNSGLQKPSPSSPFLLALLLMKLYCSVT